MKVFLAGATGVLGRALVRQLVERGHTVVGLVRSREGEQVLASLGAESRWADLFDTKALVHAAAGADTVIHAATAIPLKTRTRPADWQANDRIRREGTQALADCAGRIGAKTFIFQSVVWVATPPDGTTFDEDSPAHPNEVMRSALDGEQIAQVSAVRYGYQSAVLRCGLFYGPESAHTQAFADSLRKRNFPIVGKGETPWCCLHVEDAASAFVVTAEAGRGGRWHVTDNQPVSVNDFFTYFAAQLGAPPPRHVPAWLARLLAGKAAIEFVTRAVRTTNARFHRDLGWSPKYPTYREGLQQVVSTWKAHPA